MIRTSMCHTIQWKMVKIRKTISICKRLSHLWVKGCYINSVTVITYALFTFAYNFSFKTLRIYFCIYFCFFKLEKRPRLPDLADPKDEGEGEERHQSSKGDTTHGARGTGRSPRCRPVMGCISHVATAVHLQWDADTPPVDVAPLKHLKRERNTNNVEFSGEHSRVKMDQRQGDQWGGELLE